MNSEYGGDCEHHRTELHGAPDVRDVSDRGARAQGEDVCADARSRRARR